MFERYLTLWVGQCMLAGVALGKVMPVAVRTLRGLEFGNGSQINVPIAVLIWLMITPMMMKVDFGTIRQVGRKPAGLAVTLFVNWLVKPFSMALLAWLLFRFVFSFAGQHESQSSPEIPEWYALREDRRNHGKDQSLVRVCS